MPRERGNFEMPEWWPPRRLLQAILIPFCLANLFVGGTLRLFSATAASPRIFGEPALIGWDGSAHVVFTIIDDAAPRQTYYIDQAGKLCKETIILAETTPTPATYRLLDGKIVGRATTRLPLPSRSRGTAFPGPNGHWLFWLQDGHHSQLLFWPGKGKPALIWRGPALTVITTPRWQPTGNEVVFSTIPFGCNTLQEAQSWLVKPPAAARRLPLPAGAHDLYWRPDGQAIAFVAGKQIGIYRLATRETKIIWQGKGNASENSFSATSSNSVAPLTPPLFIRVLHRPENHCRAYAQPWQVDLIDFETYVAHVLPAEIYSSWPTATLQTQAIAARTFAWYHILHNQSRDWDVTDWVDYQMFCDNHYAPTNHAAIDTWGEYLAYGNNQPILAQYSAQNGHPTLPLGNIPYLQSVPDPVDMGEIRYGHGHGMSQIGAARWAYRHQWDAYQILHHYYTGVTIWRPPQETGRPDTTPPRASMQIPDADGYLIGMATPLYLTANDDSHTVQAVTLTFSSSSGITPTFICSDTASEDGWGRLWSPPFPITANKQITIAGQAVDTEGNIGTITPYLLTWQHVPVTASVKTVTESIGATLTLTLHWPGNRPAPQIGFSRWAWQAETLLHQPGTGEVISDTRASDGQSWRFLAEKDTPGWLYGPYTDQLPRQATYRAWFRLRGEPKANAMESVVARLDVVASGGTDLLGIRRLHGYDLLPGHYQEIPVDFHLFADTAQDVEFRIQFSGWGSLWVDRISVASYPQEAAPTMRYRLPQAQGRYTITPFFNGLGGLGWAASPLTVSKIAPEAAIAWKPIAPTGWISQTGAISASLQARGRVNPPAPETFSYRYRSANTWHEWLSPPPPSVKQGNYHWDITLPELPEGENAWQWRGQDSAGYGGDSPVYPLPVDRTPPTFTWQLPPANSAGWYTAPVTVGVIATDATSGVHTIYIHQDSQPPTAYTGPVTLAADGHYLLTAQAVDTAGNRSREDHISLDLDLSPPATPVLTVTVASGREIRMQWHTVSPAPEARYSLKIRQDDALWQTLIASSPVTTTTVTGYRGHIYRFRLRQEAPSGWVSRWRSYEVDLGGSSHFLPYYEVSAIGHGSFQSESIFTNRAEKATERHRKG